MSRSPDINTADGCFHPHGMLERIRINLRLNPWTMAAISVGRSFESDGARMERPDSRDHHNEPEAVPLPQHHWIGNRSADFRFWSKDVRITED